MRSWLQFQCGVGQLHTLRSWAVLGDTRELRRRPLLPNLLAGHLLSCDQLETRLCPPLLERRLYLCLRGNMPAGGAEGGEGTLRHREPRDAGMRAARRRVTMRRLAPGRQREESTPSSRRPPAPCASTAPATLANAPVILPMAAGVRVLRRGRRARRAGPRLGRGGRGPARGPALRPARWPAEWPAEWPATPEIRLSHPPNRAGPRAEPPPESGWPEGWPQGWPPAATTLWNARAARIRAHRGLFCPFVLRAA